MKRVGRIFGIAAASICALGTVTSCNKTGFKVGLLCLHGQTSTYDNNFIKAFEKACENLGLKEGQDYDIRTDVAEDYNEIYTAAKEWAEDGYSMVFADSFGHQYGLIDVAREYPKTEFCHATGTTAILNAEAGYHLKNYHTAFANIYKGRYLAGVAAGQKMIEDIEAKKYELKDAKIGYVGAWPYAEVISGYTSFYLGACSVFDDVYNPDWSKDPLDYRPEMFVKYTFSWYDYLAEREAAATLIKDKGCKLISQHADSMGAPQSCMAAGIPNVCYNISTKKQTPKTYLFGSKIDWEPYFEYVISKSKERYEGGLETAGISVDYVGDLNEDETGGVQTLEFGDIASEKAKEKVKQAKEELISRNRFVFDTSKFTVSKHFYGENDPKNRNPFAAFEYDGGKDSTKASHIEKATVEQYIANVIDDPKYFADTKVVKKYGDVSYVAESDYDPSIPYEGGDSAEGLRSAPFFELIIDGITTLN